MLLTGPKVIAAVLLAPPSTLVSGGYLEDRICRPRLAATEGALALAPRCGADAGEDLQSRRLASLHCRAFHLRSLG
jgi:hypothetical protein